jgi:hypothetical protein
MSEDYKEITERKRRELETSLKDRLVGEPISGSLIASFLLSAAVSAASSSVTRALSPKEHQTCR